MLCEHRKMLTDRANDGNKIDNVDMNTNRQTYVKRYGLPLRCSDLK